MVGQRLAVNAIARLRRMDLAQCCPVDARLSANPSCAPKAPRGAFSKPVREADKTQQKLKLGNRIASVAGSCSKTVAQIKDQKPTRRCARCLRGCLSPPNPSAAQPRKRRLHPPGVDGGTDLTDLM